MATLSIQSATASGPTLTRVRIQIWGTSEWQSVTLGDTLIAGYKVEAQSPGAVVERGTRTVLLKGSGTKSATVSVLLEVADVATYKVNLAKDKLGEAHVQLFRTNAATPVQFLSLNNYQTSGNCIASASVAKSHLVGEGYTMPKVDSRPLVLAFYYPWYNGDGFSFGNSGWYDRPTGSWRTDDPESVQAMVDQAAGAGIDGFVLSWDGENRGPHLDMVLDAAKNHGNFYVTTTLNAFYWYEDGQFDTDAIVAAGAAALSRANDPAFLHAGGKPVMFVYGAHQLGIDAWNSVQAQLAASGLDAFFVGEPVDSSWGFDGSYMYNPNGYSYKDLVNKNIGSMRTVRYQAQVDPAVQQRLWAATVSPGQNFSYFSPLFPQNQDRNDGKRYELTWNAAAQSTPEWILITSWNEWYEATHISPSEKFGSTALDITTYRSAAFHNPQAAGSGSESGGGLISGLPIPLKAALP